MKKRIFSLFLLLVLTGCGTPAPAEPDGPPEELPEETISLPETSPIEPLSAPAIVTEGRAPAENYTLPPSLAASQRNPQYAMLHWRDSGSIELLAEDRDAAFYALPYRDDAHETALIRLDDSLAEFDWDFVTPREYLPRIHRYDIDGDRLDELIVTCYVGSGTGISCYALHIVDQNPDGTLTDYALPHQEIYQQLSEQISIVTVADRTYAVLGRTLVDLTDNLNIDGKKAEIHDVVAGDIIYYDVNPNRIYWNPIRLVGSAWADSEDFPSTLEYMVDFESAVTFQDGLFTLSGIHLSQGLLP